MFTFAEVCLVIAVADMSSIGFADAMLAHIEGNEVTRVVAPGARTAVDADIELHDCMVDSDPLFLAWDSIQRTREGQTWVVFVEGVDSMPEVVS